MGEGGRETSIHEVSSESMRLCLGAVYACVVVRCFCLRNRVVSLCLKALVKVMVARLMWRWLLLGVEVRQRSGLVGFY